VSSDAHFAAEKSDGQTQGLVRYILDVPRKPVYRGGAAKLDSIVDGEEFLSAEQVASQCGVTTDLVYMHVRRGHLCPGKISAQMVFTRRDVARWKGLRAELAITAELEKGSNPIDIYLDAGGAFTLEDVLTVLPRWARLAGLWVVEGPRGSYARWLARLNLVRMTPRHLRRLIELLLTDPYVRERVQVVVGAPPEPSGRARLVLDGELVEAGNDAPGASFADALDTSCGGASTGAE
jgi:hypothetical protein